MKYLFLIFIDQAPIKCVPEFSPYVIVKLSMATQKLKFVYSKCGAIIPSTPKALHNSIFLLKPMVGRYATLR
jgi:hypothetical protein